jgi:hypothetical protein
MALARRVLNDKWTDVALGRPDRSVARPVLSRDQNSPDVQLESLDWGGSGKHVVLLPGHEAPRMCSTISLKLRGSYHAFGITRRGSGIESPADYARELPPIHTHPLHYSNPSS